MQKGNLNKEKNWSKVKMQIKFFKKTKQKGNLIQSPDYQPVVPGPIFQPILY